MRYILALAFLLSANSIAYCQVVPPTEVLPEIVSTGGKLTVLSIANLPPATAVIWVLPEALDDDNYRSVDLNKVYLAVPDVSTETTYNFVAVLTQNGAIKEGGQQDLPKSIVLKYAYTTGPPAPRPTPGPDDPTPTPQPSIPKGSQITVIYETETKTPEQTRLLQEIKKLGFPVLEVDPDQLISGTNKKIVVEYHYDLVVNAANLKYPAVIVCDPATGTVIRTVAFDKDVLKSLR